MENNKNDKSVKQEIDADLLKLQLGFAKNDVTTAMDRIEAAKELVHDESIKTSLETAYDELNDVIEEIEEREEGLEVKVQ